MHRERCVRNARRELDFTCSRCRYAAPVWAVGEAVGCVAQGNGLVASAEVEAIELRAEVSALDRVRAAACPRCGSRRWGRLALLSLKIVWRQASWLFGATLVVAIGASLSPLGPPTEAGPNLLWSAVTAAPLAIALVATTVASTRAVRDHVRFMVPDS